MWQGIITFNESGRRVPGKWVERGKNIYVTNVTLPLQDAITVDVRIAVSLKNCMEFQDIEAPNTYLEFISGQSVACKALIEWQGHTLMNVTTKWTIPKYDPALMTTTLTSQKFYAGPNNDLEFFYQLKKNTDVCPTGSGVKFLTDVWGTWDDEDNVYFAMVSETCTFDFSL